MSDCAWLIVQVLVCSTQGPALLADPGQPPWNNDSPNTWSTSVPPDHQNISPITALTPHWLPSPVTSPLPAIKPVDIVYCIRGHGGIASSMSDCAWLIVQEPRRSFGTKGADVSIASSEALDARTCGLLVWILGLACSVGGHPPRSPTRGRCKSTGAESLQTSAVQHCHNPMRLDQVNVLRQLTNVDRFREKSTPEPPCPNWIGFIHWLRLDRMTPSEGGCQPRENDSSKKELALLLSRNKQLEKENQRLTRELSENAERLINHRLDNVVVIEDVINGIVFETTPSYSGGSVDYDRTIGNDEVRVDTSLPDSACDVNSGFVRVDADVIGASEVRDARETTMTLEGLSSVS
ncbi:hypothetical protein HPB51_006819 [Rhipicephalus microplus]|uniref:Secreted protein n=1 Tax=Rhipicephalus microplus TaxID=6941 RepID=A0A9J6E728_RHIMP|nr:hypothetical protein HPB51_006819 [Rhipicephalus microplus]